MYASVRVHQLKDYCPRDDMWSLLYVFCDLVSGGLPWMSHAANRDRISCQKLKERIHGEEEGTPDQTEQLLCGHEYHTNLFRKLKGGIDPRDEVAENDIEVPDPLPMSRDERKVGLLRKAFEHLKAMKFSDTPDYQLIKECLEGFLDEEKVQDCETAGPIDWEQLSKDTSIKLQVRPFMGKQIPEWDFEDIMDPVDSSLFQEAEANTPWEPEARLSGGEEDLARLPLELRYRIAQMEYNALNHETIRPHLALRDWMRAALPILYSEWDSKKYERGGHRSNDDGYRREFYLKLVNRCLRCASKFDFRSMECLYYDDPNAERESSERKRRRITSTIEGPRSESKGFGLLAISQVFFRLRAEKQREERLSRAPPPRLSFG